MILNLNIIPLKKHNINDLYPESMDTLRTWIKKLLEGLFLVLFEWSRFSLTVQYRWGAVKTGH